MSMSKLKSIDMVLVPGLCFDGDGHRVGYGKGFYDRFLKTCRPDCIKIGLSYFEPVESIDDVHEGDVRLDFVSHAGSCVAATRRHGDAVIVNYRLHSLPRHSLSASPPLRVVIALSTDP